MNSSLARIFIAALVSISSFTSAFSQQPARDETRPRRTQTTDTNPQWNPPITESVSLATAAKQPTATEPFIRVALATNARSGTISTTGRLMNATGIGTTFVALNSPRVRLEPHLLSPLRQQPEDAFQIKIDGAASREEAEDNAKEIHKKFD